MPQQIARNAGFPRFGRFSAGLLAKAKLFSSAIKDRGATAVVKNRRNE